MAMSDTDAVKRSKLMSEINVALADLEAADVRLSNAKSGLGTAERELRVQREGYDKLITRLTELLPPRSPEEILRIAELHKAVA